MGTTGISQTMQETREMLLREFQWDHPSSYSHVLASARGAGGFWILREVHGCMGESSEPVTYTTATFIKMDFANGSTYYKEMDIDCHPYYYSCPKSWLSRIQPQGPGGEEWKERAAAHHTGVVKITPGLPFVINGTVYTVEKFMSGRTWIVHSPTGKQFRASTSKIRNALMA